MTMAWGRLLRAVALLVRLDMAAGVAMAAALIVVVAWR
jgi:hypothetical protein